MNSTAARLTEGRIIAIVRGVASEDMLPLVRALEAGGVRAIEVTFDQRAPESWPDTLRAIRAIADEFNGRVLPGAGTVLTPEQVRMAHDAGATYIISPDVDEAVIAQTRALGMASLPGALTPTEIMRAVRAGCDIVKIFPAGELGAGYIKSIRAPLGHVPMFAVGGVNAANAAEFMRAGVSGLGVGGALTDRALIAGRRFDLIEANARAIVEAARG
ncbi:MAG TPA: bifunctional 4-hydroxy-2-oxoglutarate aldolase/2-dehydro-3-deoxy-phosphogluconate aldolase [Candidatus Fimadaptatus faecigallinarum]|uniref:Bifunctional 4-hydroxy-2-oxoglutarate aldolase/2-dehydro-3-deoxy-phosphogluconate aldolase n=1 Tax=Candidatus Fimadaptatus faecigallinarum TaxID=2840814 RepID=A0A9D1LRT0_9FIRM|nr:bifunctional 4-hydroxy-2-oxoglutarate aldolase/2-dehydro-3-deoxy-phosphogluconate aldolase [Candidatus Fimadaptatus faecigallinarum]